MEWRRRMRRWHLALCFLGSRGVISKVIVIIVCCTDCGASSLVLLLHRLLLCSVLVLPDRRSGMRSPTILQSVASSIETGQDINGLQRIAPACCDRNRTFFSAGFFSRTFCAVFPLPAPCPGTTASAALVSFLAPSSLSVPSATPFFSAAAAFLGTDFLAAFFGAAAAAAPCGCCFSLPPCRQLEIRLTPEKETSSKDVEHDLVLAKTDRHSPLEEHSRLRPPWQRCSWQGLLLLL